MMFLPRKRIKRTARQFENCFVEWFEWPGQWSPPQHLHRTGCTVIDKGSSQVVVVFPEGGEMRKGKDAHGFMINGVAAQGFLLSPEKHKELPKEKPKPLLQDLLMSPKKSDK